jgi:hypothetical protein
MRLSLELVTPSATTELTMHYFLELEWNFFSRRRIMATL